MGDYRCSAESFNTAHALDFFCEKFKQFLRENLILFGRKCDDFWKKICRFFQQSPPIFTGNFNGFSREFGRFFHESLTVFTGTFDDFKKELDFCSKISWFLFAASPHVFYHNNSHSRKIRSILQQKSSKFLEKIAKFS